MISVIMPTFNASDYVGEAIQSILQQTYADLELIVVDDGSVDGTSQIVRQQARLDPRITFIQTDHAGANRARNAAIREARYPWIASMDADDVSLPGRLEAQLKAAQNQPEVVVWGTFIHHINSRGRILSTSKVGPTSIGEFHAMRRSGKLLQVIHPTAMMKREVLLAIGGYDERFPAAQDLELFDRMAEHGPIVAIPEPLVLYRVHRNTISMNKFQMQCYLARYLQARHQHRLQGLSPLTLEHYAEQCAKQSKVVQIRRYVDDLARLHYRRAGMHYGEGEYVRTALHLSLAMGLKPVYCVSRAYQQVVRPLLSSHRPGAPSTAAITA
jgi:glycosyltransferase involved in cell wall biosynthesis